MVRTSQGLDLQIQYHPGNANVVADALSQKTHHGVKAMKVMQLEILRDLESIAIELGFPVESGLLLGSLIVQPTLVAEIQQGQTKDEEVKRIKESINKGKAWGSVEDEYGISIFQNRISVPQNGGLKEKIKAETHNTSYYVHPGGKKMYRDLKQTFWWNNTKRDIAEYVSKCVTCQKVKVEDQRVVGELRPLEIPTWKWDSISMDFVMELPLTTSKKNAIWAIVDRFTKSAISQRYMTLGMWTISTDLC